MKQIIIDFLYLDLNICERCIATDKTLKKALDILSGVFETLDYQVKLNTVNITSSELAEKYRFVSSPTIRINGIDICNEIKENNCKDCGDLCGDSVDCRVFIYDGKEYEQPPTAMIVDGILRVLYENRPHLEETYTLPNNLKKFFSGKNIDCCNTQSHSKLRREFIMKTMSIYEPAMCCETGICGVGVDPELLRISTVFNNLKKNGVIVKRFNLNNFPQEFVNNIEINKLINGNGVEALPATVVDGKIVKTKAYPTNKEITAWLEIPVSHLGEEKVKETPKNSNGGCGCEGGCC